MVWEPVVIALVFGLLISLALHFILVWPKRTLPPASPESKATGGDGSTTSGRD